MDLATVGGLAGGCLLFAVAIILGGTGFGAFIDIPSLVITLGGMTMALFITYPLQRVLGIQKVAQKCFFGESPDFGSLYKFVELATIARRDGILALEEKMVS